MNIHPLPDAAQTSNEAESGSVLIVAMFMAIVAVGLSMATMTYLASHSQQANTAFALKGQSVQFARAGLEAGEGESGGKGGFGVGGGGFDVVLGEGDHHADEVGFRVVLFRLGEEFFGLGEITAGDFLGGVAVGVVLGVSGEGGEEKYEGEVWAHGSKMVETRDKIEVRVFEGGLRCGGREITSAEPVFAEASTGLLAFRGPWAGVCVAA